VAGGGNGAIDGAAAAQFAAGITARSDSPCDAGAARQQNCTYYRNNGGVTGDKVHCC
jgi:hypothetical protein